MSGGMESRESSKGRLGRHFRSNLVAYVALFVALGGTSYAAVNLPAKSVGTKQLKNKAVTSQKIKPGAVKTKHLAARSVGAAQVKPGSLLASNFAADQLPAGEDGPEGPQGPPGPAIIPMMARMTGSDINGPLERYGAPLGISTASTSRSSMQLMSPDVDMEITSVSAERVTADPSVGVMAAHVEVQSGDGPVDLLDCTLMPFENPSTCSSIGLLPVPANSKLSIRLEGTPLGFGPYTLFVSYTLRPATE